MANYFTRRNEQAAARLWQELLHLLMAASAAASPQLFHLADGSAAALVQQYPQDRVSLYVPVREPLQTDTHR